MSDQLHLLVGGLMRLMFLVAAICRKVAAGWPLVVAFHLRERVQERRERKADAELPFVVRPEDLAETFSPEEIELRELVEDPLGAVIAYSYNPDGTLALTSLSKTRFKSSKTK